jgi:hypothetical protein
MSKISEVNRNIMTSGRGMRIVLLTRVGVDGVVLHVVCASHEELYEFDIGEEGGLGREPGPCCQKGGALVEVCILT